jgi:hypothetical protein
MSLAVIPLAITMNAGPQIMSAIIFITANKPLRLSAYFLAGVVIAVSVGLTITYTLASVLGNSISLGDRPTDGSRDGIRDHPRRAHARRQRSFEPRHFRHHVDGASGREADGRMLRQEHDRQGRVPPDRRPPGVWRDVAKDPLYGSKRRPNPGDGGSCGASSKRSVVWVHVTDLLLRRPRDVPMVGSTREQARPGKHCNTSARRLGSY